MGKRAVPGIKTVRGQPRIKKSMSHASFTAKRHPNSKRVRNGCIM